MPTTNAHFQLAAEPNQALDVFNRPFAHAAFRSLTCEEASRLSSAQAIATERLS